MTTSTKRSRIKRKLDDYEEDYNDTFDDPAPSTGLLSRIENASTDRAAYDDDMEENDDDPYASVDC